MLASDMSIDGGGGGWGDVAEFDSGWGGGWDGGWDSGGGGYGYGVDDGSSIGADWGGYSNPSDGLAGDGLAYDDFSESSWDSSPTAYAERTGIDPGYVRDYFQSQFSDSIPGEDTPDSDYSTDQTGEPFTAFDANGWDDLPVDGLAGPDQFNGGLIQVPVGTGDTQWDVVVRSLNAFAQSAGLPPEETQNFVDYWSDRLKQGDETGLYHYDSQGKTPYSDEEFAQLQRDGVFPSELTPDKQPAIVEDLRNRQAALAEPVFRISTTAYADDAAPVGDSGSDDSSFTPIGQTSNSIAATDDWYTDPSFSSSGLRSGDLTSTSAAPDSTGATAPTATANGDTQVSPDVTGRFGQVIERSISKLPDEIRQDVEALLSPESLATMGAIAAVWGASHLVGVGEVADIVLLGVGLVTLGSEAFTVAGDVKDFIQGTIDAKTPEDLDRAASHLASAVSRAGVDTVAALLTHKATTSIKGSLPRPPVGELEMVTPEGVRVRVPAGEAPIATEPMQMSRTVPGGTPEVRLPVSRGSWLGEVGNSGWKSDIPEVNQITGNQPIPFRNNFPDFSRWSVAEVELETMTGNNRLDFPEANRLFAQQQGWLKPDGTPNAAAAQRYLQQNRLTWHHVEDLRTMQLVPTDLNGMVPHSGGAALARQRSGR